MEESVFEFELRWLINRCHHRGAKLSALILAVVNFSLSRGLKWSCCRFFLFPKRIAVLTTILDSLPKRMKRFWFSVFFHSPFSIRFIQWCTLVIQSHICISQLLILLMSKLINKNCLDSICIFPPLFLFSPCLCEWIADQNFRSDYFHIYIIRTALKIRVGIIKTVMTLCSCKKINN